MARGINKVILVGNIGQDAETKYTQAGMAITRVSLATTSVRKDRDGNQQERTEWHRVVFFGKLGEIAGEYLRKGSSIYIEGELRYDKYTDQSGVEKYTTDIVANEMQMLGGREGGGGQRDNNNSRQDGGGQRQGGNNQRQGGGGGNQNQGYGNQQGNGNQNNGGNGNQNGNRGGGGGGNQGGQPRRQGAAQQVHNNNDTGSYDPLADDIPFAKAMSLF